MWRASSANPEPAFAARLRAPAGRRGFYFYRMLAATGLLAAGDCEEDMVKTILFLMALVVFSALVLAGSLILR